MRRSISPSRSRPKSPLAWALGGNTSALRRSTRMPSAARKWFYKYACAAVEDRGSAASAYGSAFHLALEDFHGEFPRPQSIASVQMRRRIRECVTWAFERNRDGFETPVEFELQVRRAQRTAQRLHRLAAGSGEGSALRSARTRGCRGVRPGGPAVRRLYRSARPRRAFRRHRRRRLQDRKHRDERRPSIARRFAGFAIFSFLSTTGRARLAGDRVTRLVLIPLKDALLDVRPIVLHVGKNIAVDELERSRSRMIELSDELASGEIRHFETAEDPAACTYCAYATACRNKPPAEARRFGS